MTRVAREAYVLICGKYPHPQTIVPGGMSSTIDLTVMNEMFVRLAQFFDYSKKISRIWDEITEFFYEANPDYRKVGSRRANMIDTGIFDHPRRLRRHLRERRRLGRSPLGHAGRDRRRQARDDGPAHASTWASRSSSSTPSTRNGPGRRSDALPHRSRGQAAVALPPVEQGHQAASAGPELEGEVHLGHGAALGPLLDGGRLLLAAVEHRHGPEDPIRTRSWSRPGHSHEVPGAARARCRRWSSSGRCRRSGTRSSATARAPTACRSPR